ncbi:hypothetical protein JQ628_11440 [Bradyrhizobium lablabi]|uniref:hypothetical protein n=1 Tax=Bradyrhizobium lablabi TaxID=722472 RepID=UPI001BAB87A1|nr:hypothetical protein [Bradyrhizobium lablabi]MBR1122129.1 hypothetical protein [Bradyrhizobium lablabi]
MSKSLPMDLTKLIFEHEPELLACDIDATARAVNSVAAVLGCLMATILVTEPHDYEEAMQRVFRVMHESASKTALKALETQPMTAQ